ncbi:hypothetical protein P4O66_021271, partial [Electrophorus voltai]
NLRVPNFEYFRKNLPLRAKMDEYDEMYGIEDDFEQQFADELEVMAEMELEPLHHARVSGFRSKMPAPQTFEDAITSGDLASKTAGAAALSKTLGPSCDEEESLTPKAKKRKHDVAKKLQFDALQDDITPPSSPEVYGNSEGTRPGFTLSLSPDGPPVAMTASVLDISGLATLQESPKRVPTAVCRARKRPPATGDYITVTDSMGNRVYLSKKEDDDNKAPDPRFFRNSQNALGLLAVPIEVLKEQVADRRHRQLVEDSQRLTELLNRGVDPELLLDEVTEEEDGETADEGVCSRLWVDRFAPQHYIELLSDDVALLSGPPGLGKTTLAHIIARHAGYNVVEINASDDRSAELFQKRIDTATQMQSVLGANEKPNCLVIDEIDGAPSAAIGVLLATLSRKDSREGEESGANALKKKKKKESVLLRPIICICNDLYAPALRPLRQQAFLLTFPPTQPSRLAQRLAEITRRQGMKTDTGSLVALCEKTDNDIRACINTLQVTSFYMCFEYKMNLLRRRFQFLHGRGQKQLDQRVVSSVCVGLKDQNKGLFSLWQEIFQLPRLKRKRIGGDVFGALEEAGLKDGAQRLQHILHLASSNGEHEKLIQGLFDNFLAMKLKDPGLAGVCAGLDWLCFSDHVNECVLHGQNYSLMRYLPFLPAAFHFLFAANSVPRISYPNSHYEALTKTQHTKNAVVAMLAEIPPTIRSRVCQNNLCLEVLSLLLELICPKLRPVNPQLYSTREKQQLCELIDNMISYNLTYRQDRTPEGQYTYVLEPNVEDVVRFPGLPPRRQLTYQVKQLIARETELERMRRVERAQQNRNQRTSETEAAEVGRQVKRPEVKKPPARNHHHRLENIVKQAVVENKPELDFFGRAVIPKEKPAVNSATGEDAKLSGTLQIGKAVGKSDVWFRFNEGVSNAVRRSVYIRELL